MKADVTDGKPTEKRPLTAEEVQNEIAKEMALVLERERDGIIKRVGDRLGVKIDPTVKQKKN